jgi:CRISPR/Cas system CSM-associated protein Csm3 (group 7 of RAMP superfamily)
VSAQWQNSRGIQERIVVTGTLVLETPTHLGNGDADSPLDMPLILDPLEGKALLTGTSLAGALRGYLQEQFPQEQSPSLAERLFGNAVEIESVQSPLIVDDALGNVPDVELRDGVAIDLKTRTAEPKKKFDIELLAAGTNFLSHLNCWYSRINKRTCETPSRWRCEVWRKEPSAWGSVNDGALVVAVFLSGRCAGTRSRLLKV